MDRVGEGCGWGPLEVGRGGVWTGWVRAMVGVFRGRGGGVRTGWERAMVGVFRGRTWWGVDRVGDTCHVSLFLLHVCKI